MMIPGAVAGGHKYPPVVSTNSITPVPTQYTQLTFSGRIERAGNSDNSVVFHYGTSSTLASYSTTSPATAVANGTNTYDVFFTQTGLNTDNAGTTYYYRVVSTNLGGTALGEIRSATVPVRPPTVTTTAGSDSTATPTATTTNASNIARYSATLNGTATNATHCFFLRGYYVSGVPVSTSTGNTASTTSPSLSVALEEDRLQIIQLVAQNNSPQVTFNGTVNPNNRPTTVVFRYATTEAGVASSGTTVAGNAPTTNTSAQSVTANQSLSAGTYYYRVEATNAGGTSVGTPLSITIANKSVTGNTTTFNTYGYRYQYFTTPGPATWTYPGIPTGGSQINTVNVIVVGGGAGGARGAGKYTSSGITYAGAGGGGGGRRVDGVLTINGNSATIDVGEQGQGASVANGAKSGFNGGTSTITCSPTGSSFSALGGVGGVSAFLGAPNGGNSGVTQPGGAGYDAITYGYSLGGGGAGNNGAGDSATTNSAGKGGPGVNGQCGGGGGAGVYFDSGYLPTAAIGVDGGGNGGYEGGEPATTWGGGGGGGAKGSGGNGHKGFVLVQWEGP
jgi:hypothetical protein